MLRKIQPRSKGNLSKIPAKTVSVEIKAEEAPKQETEEANVEPNQEKMLESR